jgi:hypothetical protein
MSFFETNSVQNYRTIIASVKNVYKVDDWLLIESPSPGSTSIRGCLSSSTNQDFPPQPIVESRG